MVVVNIFEQFEHIATEINLIAERAGIDYIDAILEYCSRNDVDLETIGEIISKTPELKEKVKADAARLHFLK
jgi:hypothetical protein